MAQSGTAASRHPLGGASSGGTICSRRIFPKNPTASNGHPTGSARIEGHPCAVYMHTTHGRTDPPRLRDAAELAGLLGVQPDTVRRWATEGRIPVLKLGQRVLRFDYAQVVAALSSEKRQ